MSSDEPRGESSPKELEKRIKEHLLAALHVLTSLKLDATLYLFHHGQNAHRDPFSGNDLDEVYTAYEEQANDCRRLWMKLRVSSERQATRTKATGNSSPSRSRLNLERSSSPLEYQSALDEDELAEIRRDGHVTPMDIDPVVVEPDVPRPPTSMANPLPPKPKPKNSDGPVLRGVIVTPSGPTRCRLAPIPKGIKLSVETTRIPAPQNPFTFDMPQRPVINDSERRPLNRTKRNNRGADSSKNAPHSSSLSSDPQAGPSTGQTSLSLSPRRDYSSAKEYWEPRRTVRPSDFHMDEDRLFNSLDCLGPPFHVDMSKLTHNNTPASQTKLCAIYGGSHSLTPKISPKNLAKHGFNHWMVPSIEYHPYLPPRPGWPGLMLRSDDELEEWLPEGGSEFRVVVKREPKLFEYIGQYEMVRLGDITGDEWKQQSAEVRRKWTQVLGGGRLWQETVARVALRKKQGKEPSVGDLAKFTTESYTTLSKDLKDDIDRAFCEGEEVIAVWGMKCVGYDFKFENHLARSLKTIEPPSSGSAKKRKTITGNGDDAMSEGGDEEKGEDSELDDTHSKRQRIAKGKAKLIKYDWSDVKVHGDSKDEDYTPS